VFPTPWTVWIHRYSTTAVNAHNNPVRTYTPAVDATGEPIRAIGWDVTETEPSADQVADRVTLYIPQVLRSPEGVEVDLPKSTDLIDLPVKGGVKQYEVTGVRDYNHGFHAWQPGYIVDLQRATP
jgi:hypothetical protein